MEQLFEFMGNHWILVSVWFVFLMAFFWDNGQRSGQTVSTTQATQMINKQNALVLDIRDKKEFNEGHLADALNIPYGSLADRMSELESAKERPIILVCKSGQTVGIAGKTLKQKGYQVFRMSGGMMEWRNQNLPVVVS
jgi:rhodanese-related sulfurtransferase